MKKINKALAILAVLALTLVGCTNTAPPTKLEVAPFYEMLEDTTFTNSEQTPEKSFVLKKGQTVFGEINAAGDLAIRFDTVVYTTANKNIKGVEQMQQQPMVAMLSVDLLEVLADVAIIDNEGAVLAQTKTALVPTHYLRELQMDNVTYYEISLAGNLGYVRTTDSKLHKAS